MSTAARLQRLRAEVESDRYAAAERMDELTSLELATETDPGTLDSAQLAQRQRDVRALRPYLAADLDGLDGFLRGLVERAAD